MAAGEPRVSIILRTKDRPVLLARALRDVAEQRFDDWHLLVVNDGGAREVVEALVDEVMAVAGRREQVRTLHHEHSLGMEGATNAALAAASGEFVCVHDDDDTWDPAFLERTVQHLVDHPAASAVVVRTDIVYEEVRGQQVSELRREPFWPELVAITLFDLIRTNRFVPISLLYRRAVHDAVGPYREDLPMVGDWEFHLRLAQRFSVDLLDETLAFWHQRPSQNGSLGTSVHVDGREHDRWDLVLRDEALRTHAEKHGLGDLLYLTRYLQGEFDHLHIRITELERMNEHLAERAAHVEEAAREGGLIALLRRKYWSARTRLGASGRSDS